jgi:tetratricopeptide (TPR) repeat protein
MVFGSARAAEVLPKAKALAVKAVDLDESLAEAHASLGSVREREYDWKGAEREYRRAIELRPGYATAHQWYGLLLRTLGRTAEEHLEIERARQLDPTSLVINGNVAAMYFEDRDYERAIVQATKTLELEPTSNLALLPLVLSYEATGRYAQALATLDKAGKTPWSTVGLWRAHVLAASGDRATAERLVAEYEHSAGDGPLPNGAIAAVRLALGDVDGAFRWLDRAADERNPVILNIKSSPLWDPIRSDPRYHKLLERVNLE